MKQYIAVFLLTCLFLPISGTFFWLKFQQKQVRKEVKHQLMTQAHEDDLTLLVFSIEESEKLGWKHDKEFEYRGTMYDIVHTTRTADSIYYRVFPDKKETKLHRQLVRLATDAFGNDPFQQKHQKLLRQFYSTLFFQSVASWQPRVLFNSSQNQIPYYLRLQSIVLSTDDPPPQEIPAFRII